MNRKGTLLTVAILAAMLLVALLSGCAFKRNADGFEFYAWTVRDPSK